MKKILSAFLLLLFLSQAAIGANTANKGYNNQTTGTNTGTWGVVLNQNFSIIDNNLGGTLTLSVAGNSNVTLSSAQAQNLIYNFTGVLTGNINVVFPAAGGLYFINNQTTGAFTLTIQAGSSTSGVLIPQGTQVPVYVDNSTMPPTVGGATGTQYVFNAGTVGGTANALTVSNTFPSNFSLNNGTIITLTPASTNTESATLNVSGSGAIGVKKTGAIGLVNLQAGDLFAGTPALMQYNGTNWVDLSAVYFGNTPTQVSSNFALSFSNWLAPSIATSPITITVPQVSANFTYFFSTWITAGGGAVTFTPFSTDVIWVNGVAQSAGANYVLPIGYSAYFTTDANGNIYLIVSSVAVNGASSITQNGYQVFPSGLIEEWGTTVNIAAGGTQGISFPLSFPNNVFSVTYSQNTPGSAASSASGFTSGPSQGGFTLENQSNVMSKFNWFATGN